MTEKGKDDLRNIIRLVIEISAIIWAAATVVSRVGQLESEFKDIKHKQEILENRLYELRRGDK